MGTKSTVKPETKTVGIGSQILKELGLKDTHFLDVAATIQNIGDTDFIAALLQGRTAEGYEDGYDEGYDDGSNGTRKQTVRQGV